MDLKERDRMALCDFAASERWLLVCATFALGVVLFSNQPAKGHCLNKSVFQKSILGVVTYTPTVASAPPAIANPKQCAGSTPPPQKSAEAVTVTYKTTRRTTRTRHGGLYGP